MSFREYAEHGWQLVPVQPKTKGPRTRGWNLEENCISDPDTAETLAGAGLAHAYSGTCVVDVDDWDLSVDWLQAKGIDLDALRLADDTVQITSGRANRGKLLYKIPDGVDPLPSLKLAQGAFELRCASRNGRTVQDLLPPSIHPNGKRYEWLYNEDGRTWRDAPELPAEILALWRTQIGDKHTQNPRDRTAQKPGNSTAACKDIARLLESFDPGTDYDEWVKVGMALHHEYDGDAAGLAIWDTWSSKSDKYPGFRQLEGHWESFGQGGDGGNPVTLGSLRQEQVASVDEFEDLDAIEDDEYADLWEAAQPVDRFRFLDLDELESLPPPEWIIEDVMPVCDVGCVFGQPGAGKTFAALDLVLAIARGINWRDLETKQGGVLYVAAEDDAGVRLRLGAYVSYHELDNTLPIRTLCEAPNVRDKSTQKALRVAVKDAAAEIDARVIIIDTLASVTPGADENSSQDMTPLVDYCKQLHKDTGASVIVVHHEGKTTGRGPRGSSALHGAFGVELLVAEDSGGKFILVDKMKNGPRGAMYPFDLEVVDASHGLTSCVLEHREPREDSQQEIQSKQLSPYQQSVFNAANELAMFGEVPEGEVLSLSIDGIPEQLDKNGRDRRKQYARDALQKLVLSGLLLLSKGMVSLPGEDDEVGDLL